MSTDCPLCIFFAACASAMGVTRDSALLFARLVPYRFTADLPTPSSCSSSGRDGSVTNIRVLELLTGYGDWRHLSSSAAFGPPSWPKTHLVLPAQPYNTKGQVSDTVDCGIISEWLPYCQLTHQTCTTAHSSPLATIVPGLHLIDCHNRTIIPAEKIETSTYVTLSYVWGSEPVNLELLDSSAAAPILPDSSRLPKVISDAMEVVRCLGYSYLWVDRYCIPQGDSQVKHLQMRSMGKIYALSDLTIIAAAGENAEYGLPGVTSLRTPQLWTTINCNTWQQPVIYFSPPNYAIGRSVWASRGWTHQEALLSRRRLVFTDRHVFFQCQLFETVGAEPYPDPRRPGGLAMPEPVFPPLISDYDTLHGHQSSEIWKRITEFVRRTLSYEEDSLNAMEGIFGVWREGHDMWFLYGLPLPKHDHVKIEASEQPGPPMRHDTRYNSLLHGLFWRDKWFLNAQSPSPQPRRSMFPSWTWAGWKSSTHELSVKSSGAPTASVLFTLNAELVRVSFSYDDRTLDWAKHREAILRRSDSSHFPRFLIIRAEFFYATITYTTDFSDNFFGGGDYSYWNFSSPNFLKHLKNNSIGARSIMRPDIPPGLFEDVEGGYHRLLVLPLFIGRESCRDSVHILLLREVGEDDDDDDDDDGPVYERVSCFGLWRESFTGDVWPPKFEVRRMGVRVR